MFSVDFMARQPLYEQIYLSAVNLISHGVLAPNEKLPPIRSVAAELGINPNTVTKAYQMLEKDGYIYTVQGKGCFVAEKNKDLIMEENLKKIEEHIAEIYEIADICGLEQNEIIKMFILYGEER